MNVSLKHPTLYIFTWLIILILAACSGPEPTLVSTELDNPTATNAVENIPTKMPTATLTPTPEPPPALTALPIPRLYMINVALGNETPSDLLEYVFLYQGSFGGRGECVVNGSPTWKAAYNGTSTPAIPGFITWDAINLPNDSVPQGLLTLPDGSQLLLDIWMKMGGCANAQVDIAPGTLLGSYSYELKQGDTILTDSVILAMPTDPIQVAYEESWWFAGFEPNEQVTLSIYYGSNLSEFLQPEFASMFPDMPAYVEYFEPSELDSYEVKAYLDQQVVSADENGAFLIGFTSDQLRLFNDFGRSMVGIVARGELSGLAANIDALKFAGSCNGSLPSRLNIGDDAQVTDYGSQQDYYYHNNISQGTTMTLAFGPLCEQAWGDSWEWLVVYDNTYIRVFEGDAEGYFLEPVEP